MIVYHGGKQEIKKPRILAVSYTHLPRSTS